MVHWFQGSFPDGCLGDKVLTGDLESCLTTEFAGVCFWMSEENFP